MKSNMMQTGWQAKRGFTFELLVVIAIIAILAAMLLPTLSKAKDSAKKAQAKTEMQNIAAAVRQYNAEYNRYPMPTKIADSLTLASPDYTYGTMHMTGMGQSFENKAGENLPKIASPGRIQSATRNWCRSCRGRKAETERSTDLEPQPQIEPSQGEIPERP